MEVITAPLPDFNLVEIRLIQSLWDKKPIIFIANVLGRPFDEVAAAVRDLASKQKIKLFQYETFERKIKKSEQREAAWAKKQLQPDKIRVKDTSQLISVRIDTKTIVFVKPGTDIEALKEKYRKPKIV